MEPIFLLLRSVLIGFSIAAPVGPIGVLVIRRTLSEGRLMGLITGLGAATADALYGAVGAFGLSLVTTWLTQGEGWLRVVGGLFLCWLGLRTLLAKPAENAAAMPGVAGISAFSTTFALTLTNPLTILSFAAIFAGLGFGTDGTDVRAAVTVVTGVFLGSALWWVALSGAVALLRHRLSDDALLWVNRLSGGIIVAFGVIALSGT